MKLSKFFTDVVNINTSAFIIMFIFSFSYQANAHTGGLNRHGCHNDKDTWHCHQVVVESSEYKEEPGCNEDGHIYETGEKIKGRTCTLRGSWELNPCYIEDTPYAEGEEIEGRVCTRNGRWNIKRKTKVQKEERVIRSAF